MPAARYRLTHSKYTGSEDADGYPTGDNFADPVVRSFVKVYPLSSQLSEAGDYDRRVVTSQVVMVLDTAPYSARDKIILPGAGTEDERTYFVSEDVRDYGIKGEVVIEKVQG